MLFSYHYVAHKMETMQRFIDFIFFEVWCKAPTTKAYSLDLFQPLPDLWEVMRDFTFADPQPVGAKFFCEHVESIYKQFVGLSKQDIAKFKRCYKANNDVEKTCKDLTAAIARYVDIRNSHPLLEKELASFFCGLYDSSLLSLATLRAKIGTIEEHYKVFFATNNIGTCPFCGLHDLKSIHHTRREAYDHYLPKFRYPFNSINFYNLAPACAECNSAYKLSKDPVYTPKNSIGGTKRRKAFYPYSKTTHKVDIHVTLGPVDSKSLTISDAKLSLGPPNLREEIETWKDVYGINERYRAKLLSPAAKGWLEEQLILQRINKTSARKYLKAMEEVYVKLPYANQNFLRLPFLRACFQQGLKI